jgi:hypothetical protein
VALDVRVKSYRVLVELVLLYNCGTWALYSFLAVKIDRAQRKMLRRVDWRDAITVEILDARCNAVSASVQVVNARWKLVGLGEKSHKARQGNVSTIASVISDERKTVFIKYIKTKSQYEAVAMLTQDREQWREIVQNVTQNLLQKYCASREEIRKWQKREE